MVGIDYPGEDRARKALIDEIVLREPTGTAQYAKSIEERSLLRRFTGNTLKTKTIH